MKKNRGKLSQENVGVALVTFNNSREELKQLLYSLEVSYEQARSAGLVDRLTLFVRDNGEKSWLTSSIIAVQYLKDHGQNIGYPSGMQTLLEYGFSQNVDVIISANPDGHFHPDCILNLLLAFKKYPHDLIEAAQFPEEHPKEYDIDSLKTEWASGCCCLISREIFVATGGLDSSFFLYVEDVDLSWRVRLLGRNVRFIPNALFFHPVLNRKPSPFAVKCIYESGRYFAHKWRSKEFLEFCESVLLAEGFYSKKSQLKKLKSKSIVNKKEASSVVDFSHKFHFSKIRWEL